MSTGDGSENGASTERIDGGCPHRRRITAEGGGVLFA
jgi:hypothetical protein